jgi:hypothetical protein
VENKNGLQSRKPLIQPGCAGLQPATGRTTFASSANVSERELAMLISLSQKPRECADLPGH